MLDRQREGDGAEISRQAVTRQLRFIALEHVPYALFLAIKPFPRLRRARPGTEEFIRVEASAHYKLLGFYTWETAVEDVVDDICCLRKEWFQ